MPLLLFQKVPRARYFLYQVKNFALEVKIYILYLNIHI